MTYETRKLREIEFPMFFSLAPDPGYNLSFLETSAIDGEFHLFHGDFLKSDDNRTGYLTWGGDCFIEGNSSTLR